MENSSLKDMTHYWLYVRLSMHLLYLETHNKEQMFVPACSPSLFRRVQNQRAWFECFNRLFLFRPLKKKKMSLLIILKHLYRGPVQLNELFISRKQQTHLTA